VSRSRDKAPSSGTWERPGGAQHHQRGHVATLSVAYEQSVEGQIGEKQRRLSARVVSELAYRKRARRGREYCKRATRSTSKGASSTALAGREGPTRLQHRDQCQQIILLAAMGLQLKARRAGVLRRPRRGTPPGGGRGTRRNPARTSPSARRRGRRPRSDGGGTTRNPAYLRRGLFYLRR